MKPARYKGAHGGRASGKSHHFAGMLVERCVLVPRTRWVCLREIQLSLKQSSKLLVEDKIAQYGIGSMFRVLEDRIITPGDGVISFSGMQNHTAESLKSLEDFDGAWFDEAHRASVKSLGLLRPTIRKDGSELWFSWNPASPKDAVEKLLRGPERQTNAIVVEANYRDNPFLPISAREEMEADKRRDPERYAHVWLGQYQQHSSARVFHNWEVDEFETPATHEEWEELGVKKRFYYGADWGFATDPTVLVRCWIKGKTLLVDQEAWMVGCEIDNTPRLFQRIEESDRWPITADSANPQSISYMRRFGFPKMVPSVKGVGSIEEGIEFLKSFDIIVHPRCEHVIDELSNYSYEIDAKTEEVLPVLADRKNHCLVGDSLVLTARGAIPIADVLIGDMVMTREGLRRVLFSGPTDVGRDVVRVRTTLGDVVCTPDHEVYTTKGFVRADALRYNDEVVGDEAWSKACGTTVSGTIDIPITRRHRQGYIFGGRARAAFGSFFTGMCGKIISAQYRRAITSITRTAIQPIMIFPIWNVSRPPTMQISIHGARNAGGINLSYLIASDRSPRYGTRRKQVAKSIGRSAGWLIEALSRCLSRVPTVARNLCPGRSATPTCSVATLARLLGAELVASMTKAGNAVNVGERLRSTNMSKHKPVRGRVLTVTALGKSDFVYDLTVEQDHEFFANGVLVSNCIDALRYSIESLRRATRGAGVGRY